MTEVLNLPPSLDDRTFENVLEALATVPPDAKVLLNARHTRWASPYGLTALLTLAQSRSEPPVLYVPEADETAHYWARTGFFTHAATLFELHGQVPRVHVSGESDVLLEITPVSRSEDVHEVVSRIQKKSQQILVKELALDAKATMGFAMTLSEACQNIVEHAGRGGWVAVQTYRWQKRLGRRVVVIAVCDAGVGFRQSLESAPGHRPGDRWDDGTALEEAVIRGVSRFRDSGRGQGLAGIRRYIGRWDGKLSVRSGTARIAIIPSWDDDVPLQKDLSPFPGTQMQITIPERIADR
jgi:anti-sigma regulatory factor (Ser/Thr protein kinase)